MRVVIYLQNLKAEDIEYLKSQTKEMNIHFYTNGTETKITAYGIYDDLVYLISLSSKFSNFQARLI